MTWRPSSQVADQVAERVVKSRERVVELKESGRAVASKGKAEARASRDARGAVSGLRVRNGAFDLVCG